MFILSKLIIVLAGIFITKLKGKIKWVRIKNLGTQIPENAACVLWKAKIFSKERGNIEGGRYDEYYNCFCGTASLFVNRSIIKQWIYCKDVFDILDQNIRLQSELNKQIKDNRKMVKALNVYANTEPYLLRKDAFGNKQYLDVRKIAQDVLKEVEEAEEWLTLKI